MLSLYSAVEKLKSQYKIVKNKIDWLIKIRCKRRVVSTKKESPQAKAPPKRWMKT
jgi:hypothetical protein